MNKVKRRSRGPTVYSMTAIAHGWVTDGLPLILEAHSTARKMKSLPEMHILFCRLEMVPPRCTTVAPKKKAR